MKPYSKPLFESDYENEAIDYLKSNLTGVHSLVCFSGGKDSICIEHLMKLSGLSYSLNSTLTGIDPPQVTRFIRQNYPICSFVRPRLSFWHLLTTHNPPGGTGRGIKWCCTKIKENPSFVIPIQNRITGIRAEESSNRKKYLRTGYVDNQTIFLPIFYWKEWQIWEFIDKYKLPYPTLYDEGFNRIGCVVCPNHQNHHDLYRDKWPKHFQCFERYVKIWWDKRVNQGHNMWHETVQDFLTDWYAGKFYYYKPEIANKPFQADASHR